jgi:hypothetical protein
MDKVPGARSKRCSKNELNRRIKIGFQKERPGVTLPIAKRCFGLALALLRVKAGVIEDRLSAIQT